MGVEPYEGICANIDISCRRWAIFDDTHYKIILRQLIAILGLNTNGSFSRYVLHSVVENKLNSSLEDVLREVFPESCGVNVTHEQLVAVNDHNLQVLW